MKSSTLTLVTLLFSILLRIPSSHAEDPVVIRNSDMFNQVGQYYRAYLNARGDSLLSGTRETVPVRQLIGEPGGPHLWDFSEGPTDETIRVDYVNPQGTVPGHFFPDIEFAERMQFESNGETKWLMIEQKPLIGRKVYGFFDPTWDDLGVVFNTAIVDFPDPMRYGDKWSTTVAIQSALSVLGFETPVRYTSVSEFEVDGWGYINLPELGFGDVLRVNEKVTTTQAIRSDFFPSTGDGDGEDNVSFTDVGKTIHRNLYFFRPGFGLVAEIHSTTSEADPGSSFSDALFFSRMFETNREPSVGCQEPQAAGNLVLSYNAGRVLLKWDTADCTDSYRVEYSSRGGVPGSWNLLESTQSTFIVDNQALQDASRIYRVISVLSQP